MRDERYTEGGCAKTAIVYVHHNKTRSPNFGITKRYQSTLTRWKKRHRNWYDEKEDREGQELQSNPSGELRV